MKFLCNSMLGRLAKWLRILGYDTAYLQEKTDKELIELARKEGRILLTRDRHLSREWLTPTLYIESQEIDDQLTQVVDRYHLDLEENLFCRCPLCNHLLSPIDKEEVKEGVPPFVYETYHQFFFCPDCHKTYWPGTHWENIKKKVEEIRGKDDWAKRRD
ncbi:TPA: hypothetical protein DCX15_06160 [bacterium]|nr:hypothetical protein [bacterium]